jgi:hypothetical protein
MTQLHAHWTGKCWDNVQTKHMCQVMTKHMCVPNVVCWSAKPVETTV